MTNSRKIVFEALIKIEEGGYSNIVISNALDKNELSDRDRAFSSALFYGVLERAITLDKIISEFSTQKASKLSVYVKTALRMGIYQLVFMDKIPDSAAVNESVNLVKRTKASRYSGFVNGVLRNISRTDKEKLLDFSFVQQTDKRLSFEYSVPDWMAGLFVRNYGESFTRDMLCAFNGRNSTVLRVNTLKIRPEDFVNELINSIREQKNEQFRNKYRSIDVLIVDDIQFIAGKISSEEEFFHTFNFLSLANKQIILSSDRPPKEMHTLEERLRTRFESGLLVDIQPPDFETRAAILKQKAEQFNLAIDDTLIKHIASKVTSNVRELEGTIKKIAALSGFSKNDVTMEIVEKALVDFNVVNAGIVTPSTIINFVEKYFNLKENSLVSLKRTKNISFARQIAMYIMRELTEMSTPKIGQELGGRDHTTILHGIEKIEHDINNDSTVKNMVDDIIKNIRNR